MPTLDHQKHTLTFIFGNGTEPEAAYGTIRQTQNKRDRHNTVRPAHDEGILLLKNNAELSRKSLSPVSLDVERGSAVIF